MIAVDLACFAAAACFAARGSADVLSRADSLSFRVFYALVAAWLALKGFVYFAYTVVFLMVDLFAVVPPFVVVVILALPVLYLGTKGLRGIARCAELFTPVLFLILLGSLAFLEADLDVGRNLPLEGNGPPTSSSLAGSASGCGRATSFPSFSCASNANANSPSCPSARGYPTPSSPS